MKLCWTYCKVRADFPTPPSPKTTILYLRTPPEAAAVADIFVCLVFEPRYLQEPSIAFHFKRLDSLLELSIQGPALAAV